MIMMIISQDNNRIVNIDNITQIYVKEDLDKLFLDDYKEEK